MSDERSVRTRVEDRLRASTMRELMRLRVRATAVEEAAAENRALRPGLERVVAQLEAEVARFGRA